MRPVLISAFLLASISVMPAGAGELTTLVPERLKAFGEKAGYIAATVPRCGGDEEEVQYFKRIVRDLLSKVGGDAEDWALVDQHLEAARRVAKPTSVDCLDEIGRGHAEELMKIQSRIREGID